MDHHVAAVAVSVALAIMLLARDAMWQQGGSLRYEDGHWFWLCEHTELAGRMRLQMDFQTYMLVTFSPHRGLNPLPSARRVWFHLELAQASTTEADWLALRRAVHATWTSSAL